MKKPRGRPRKFDRDAALDGALGVFWAQGFSAASLDDLASAMGMNRPSIYNAFGDKEALYREALGRFAAQLSEGLSLLEGGDPAKTLASFFSQALDVYMGDAPALGCMIFCTAPSAAITNPMVRGDLNRTVVEIDKAFETFFKSAYANHGAPEPLDAKSAAQMAQATLHSLALRARAGQSRSSLKKMARSAVTMLLPGVDK
jgi:AcrR family transcriptional regulator